MSTKDRICKRCVMDTTDPHIQFDEGGICNHCRRYDEKLKGHVFPGREGERRLQVIIDEIKREGKSKAYDCVIGVSGGVDSTFVAYKVKQLGLRPLVVHLDNGWDSEFAVSNIERALGKLDIDLYTHVIDWEEFKDLQLSFLKASTPDSEIPTDHAIRALMYQMAEKIGSRFILSGHNHRTESHLPDAWSYGHADWKYIKSIHKRFGSVRLKTYPHMDFRSHNRYRRTIQILPLLNYLDYVKKEAIGILERELGWKYYGGKHYESIYTRFYQGYILPKKFGFDKRKSHLSSLICSGETTKEEALEELKKETYPIELQEEDRRYVIKKLDLTEGEFGEIMDLPKKTFRDYPSYESPNGSTLYRRFQSLLQAIS